MVFGILWLVSRKVRQAWVNLGPQLGPRWQAVLGHPALGPVVTLATTAAVM